jgi:hypothetical protein
MELICNKRQWPTSHLYKNKATLLACVLIGGVEVCRRHAKHRNPPEYLGKTKKNEKKKELY